MLLNLLGFAHKADTASLSIAIKDFDKALITKDSIVLKRLLNSELDYGHSNGWLQTKTTLINDLYNGKITYNKINIISQKITLFHKTATVRISADFEAYLEYKTTQFKLNVLQVWIWKHKQWQLLARQSVRI